MKLAYWMYSGPAHIGTLRIATSFKGVHAIMHAPLGDDYFNVMRSMMERQRDFTKVTASVVDRHVLARGSKDKVVSNIARQRRENKSDLIVVTPTCTSSILQEDLHNFVHRASLETNCDVLLADINHYRVNELEAADKTLQQIIKLYVQPKFQGAPDTPTVNIIGSFSLAFHNQHDIIEVKRLLQDLQIQINLVVPGNLAVTDLTKMSNASLNIVLYREIGLLAAEWLQAETGIPYISISPIGISNLADWIAELEQQLKKLNYDVDFQGYIGKQTKFQSQAAWFARSIDCQNLTGKKAFVFADSSHASAFARVLHSELDVRVLVCGTYCQHDHLWFKAFVGNFCDQVLLTDHSSLVSDFIVKAQPDAIFGTQMERHIGKKLGIPCAVISAPIHIQNFPIGYRPFVGYEGVNQIADLIYNSFVLGMEDHLLDIFGGHDSPAAATPQNSDAMYEWSEPAKIHLQKIPAFVRSKIKQQVEAYASSVNQNQITLELMYEAKERAPSFSAAGRLTGTGS